MENQPQLTKPTNKTLWIVFAIVVLAIAIYGIYAYISGNTNQNTNTVSNISISTNQNINKANNTNTTVNINTAVDSNTNTDYLKSPTFDNDNDVVLNDGEITKNDIKFDVVAIQDNQTDFFNFNASNNKIFVSEISGNGTEKVSGEIKKYLSSDFNNLVDRFCPYGCEFGGGIRLGKGYRDYHLIVTPNNNFEPLLKIYDINTFEILNTYYAYDKSMQSGFKAVGFIDQKGDEHVATVPNYGGLPELKLFDRQPSKPYWSNGPGGYSTSPGTDVAGTKYPGQYVYHRDFKGGVDIAVGDVNNDREIEIVTIPESSSKALVRVFQLSSTGDQLIKIISEFTVFENDSMGANIEINDLDSDGVDDIILINGNKDKGDIKIVGWNGTEKTNFTRRNLLPTGVNESKFSFSGFIKNDSIINAFKLLFVTREDNDIKLVTEEFLIK